MEKMLACFPVNPATLDENPSLNVVIAYEDFETGKRAKRTYDFLVENIGSGWQVTNQMWKFDVLVLPKLRDIAVDDAVRADIIMISSHEHDLPAHVKKWIESWLAGESNPLALVALFESARAGAGPDNVARRYLANVARRGNMEFFAQRDVRPRHITPEAAVAAHDESRSNGKTLSSLAEVVHLDLKAPRWTIDD
jgi:hypothetical protein